MSSTVHRAAGLQRESRGGWRRAQPPRVSKLDRDMADRGSLRPPTHHRQSAPGIEFQADRSQEEGVSKTQSADDSMVARLADQTGKALPEWVALLSRSSLQKHGEIVNWLKSKHAVGTVMPI